MEMVEKLLGFAVKANKIAFGTDNILKSKVYLIIVSGSLSDGAVNKLKNAKKDVPIYLSSTGVDILIKRDGCKAVGVKDNQMANAIINNFDSNYQRITLEEN